MHRHWELLDYAKMRQLHSWRIEDFEYTGDTVQTQWGRYIYRDNGSNLLAVAHLDTVQGKPGFALYKTNDNDRIVESPQLDDRLGVYVILDLLPKLGINCDVLLTEGEEMGMSTAQWFTTEKKYHWLFQFDRAGDDCVNYSYSDQEFDSRLRDVGWRVDRGLFSDICFLEHLGAKGFNVGVGYYDYHSAKAWASMRDMLTGVSRFEEFYRRWKDTPMPHKEAVTEWRGWGNWGREYTCTECGEPITGKGLWCDSCSQLYDLGVCVWCDDVAPVDNFGLCAKCQDRERETT